MKKWLILVLAALTSLPIPPILAEEKPIPAQIQWLQAVGFLTGDENRDLQLSEMVTRAEAAALVIRAIGLEQARWETPETAPYSDVAPEHWASGYIARAAADGILSGYPDGTFCPEGTVLYEELMKMLVTALGYEAAVPALPYPENYIQTAHELKLTEGIDASQGQALNRLQAAQILKNAFSVTLFESKTTMCETYLNAAGKTDAKDIISSGGGGGGSGASSSSIFEDSVGGETPDTAIPSIPGAVYSPVPAPDSDHGETANQLSPLPGQLTAGRWDDHKNWQDWLLLMSNREYHELQSQWGISSDRYEVHILTETGEPVWDAAVTLYDGNGGLLWQSRTDRLGTAYIFAVQPAEYQQENTFSISVQGRDGQQLKEAVQLFDDTPLELYLPGAEEPEGLDLMFVIDTTGSMGDELQYIKEELKDVVQKIDTPVRLSCNFYRDFSDVYTIRPFPFETELDSVMSQISQQRAQGGGDYEEAVDLALIDAVEEHDWSESARARLLFLVLDAPPHLNETVISNIQAVTAAASKQGIRIIPVASSGVDKNTEFLMRTLAIATNGTYLFLTDDSGIGNSHIEPTIGEYEVTYLNDLILSVIQEYIGQTEQA